MADIATIITSVVSSTVVATIILVIFTKMNNDKNARLKYVTEERQKWRSDIRKLTENISKAYNSNKADALKEYLVSLKIRLNPDSDNLNEDKKIIDLMEKIIKNPNNKSTLEEFINAISILLKFEWEKAKFEAGSLKKEPKRQQIKGELTNGKNNQI